MSKDLKLLLGQQLKLLRINNNFTQKEIADFLNVTLRAYQYYEVGQRFPSIEALVSLSRKYNVPLSMILYGDTPLEPFILSADNSKDIELLKFFADKADGLGISIDELISYVLLNSTFNSD